jgi:hypothetical protein
MTKYFLSLILVVFSQVAFSGPRVGNGGDVVVCSGPGQKAIELLDHYEARTLRKIQVNLGGPNDSVEAILEAIFTRLSRVDNTRAVLFRQWFASFSADAELTEDNIVQIPDTGAVTFPKGCEILQIAIHQDPDIPGDRRYIIRKDLWNLLDNQGKAGLILHELIYRDLISQEVAPHTSSKFVRYFNAYLSSDAFTQLQLHSYYELLLKLNFATMDTQYGFPIMILKESPGGVVPAKVDFDGDLITFAEKPASFRVSLTYNWHGVLLPVIEGVCSVQPRRFNYQGVPLCVDTSVSPLVFDFKWARGTINWDAYQASLNISDDQILTVSRYCKEPKTTSFVSFEGQVQGQSQHVSAQGVMVGFVEKKVVETLRETALCVDEKFRKFPF